MLDIDLTKRKAELRSDITALEARLHPLERELSLKKQEYDLISRLVGLRAGGSDNSEAPRSETELAPSRLGPTLRLNAASSSPTKAWRDDENTRVFTEYHGIWADICEVHGWSTGKDSAHRVAIREDPEVHSRVAHQCRYDGETYP